jgi:hypothetical protein
MVLAKRSAILDFGNHLHNRAQHSAKADVSFFFFFPEKASLSFFS